MLTWFAENIGTILVLAAMIAVAVLIIVKMRKDKKKGRSSCGAGCAGCPMAGKCHSIK